MFVQFSIMEERHFAKFHKTTENRNFENCRTGQGKNLEISRF